MDGSPAGTPAAWSRGGGGGEGAEGCTSLSVVWSGLLGAGLTSWCACALEAACGGMVCCAGIICIGSKVPYHRLYAGETTHRYAEHGQCRPHA